MASRGRRRGPRRSYDGSVVAPFDAPDDAAVSSADVSFADVSSADVSSADVSFADVSEEAAEAVGGMEEAGG